MNAEIITIGDEILRGDTLDTNSNWLAYELSKIDITVSKISSISDEKEVIYKSIRNSLSRSQFIILTGGLGPTNDDITKSVLCDYFKDHLVLNNKVLNQIESLFKQFNKTVTVSNRQQAFVPSKCKVIHNKWGTAPGMWFTQDDKDVLSFPGVPFEMKNIFLSIIEIIKSKYKLKSIYNETVLTQGVAESHLFENLDIWMQKKPKNLKVSFLPSAGLVKIRLSSRNKHIFKSQLSKLKKQLNDIIYGFNNDTLQQIVVDLLLENNKTIAIAESCTGGAIQQLITSVSGSSKCFKGGMVVYSNKMKITQLNIKQSTIKKYREVSKQVAAEMARNIQQKFNSDFSIATTGFAGPTGGTKKNPVGTIYIGIVTPEKSYVKKMQIGLGRDYFIRVASLTALNIIRKEIIDL